MGLSTRNASYLCLLLAIVPACSSHTDPDVPTPQPDGGTVNPDAGAAPDAADIDEVCAESAALDCEWWKRCEPMYLEWYYGGINACVARSKEECLVSSALPGAKAKGPEFLACNRAALERSCSDWTLTPECSYPRGDLEQGASCQTSVQCATGHCRRPLGEDVCGTCEEKGDPGADCTRSADCKVGRCEARKCSPDRKEGDACTGIVCTTTLACAAGVCKKLTWANAGEPCGDEKAIWCKSGQCMSGICVADGVVEIGEKCGPADDGRVVYCRNSECSLDNQCVKFPEIGAACSEVQGLCAGSAVCVRGVCKGLSTDVCSDLPGEANGDSSLNETERRSIMGHPSRMSPGPMHRLRD
jgi:hypothetical protein